ncbi:MAG TPA: prenyltransferase/squalene oxidase repeat-containing protein [Kiritimatiellia bacterium]|nr:prenyltransferase/squalene oxidase repeat-containing protein [Kiritimatiellia bacterium]
MERITRRKFLKTVGAAAPAAGWVTGGAASPDAGGTEAFREAVTRYLETLARSDGGYGWEDQEDSFLTETYAAVGAYHALGMRPPRPAETAAYVRRAHPINGPYAQTRRHWAEIKEFVFQQIQTLLWLGEPAGEGFSRQVAGWRKVSGYTTAYEKGGNPVFRQEVQPLLCRVLLGLPCETLAEAFGGYLEARRRPDGTFNNTPAADGSGGHLVNTFFGIRAQQALGIAPRPAALDWIRRCQRPDGGFSWCPEPEVGGLSDLSYTWAAIRTLELLGGKPVRPEACRDWIRSLWNADGGFADRPGGVSSALATYQACDILARTGGGLRDTGPQDRPSRRRSVIPADLHAFTIQFEAPGEGSVIEAVELAKALKIHLWGAKNSRPGWREAAQACAEERGVPVTFFASDEAYGTRVSLPGLGSYTHVNDPVAAPGRPVPAWPRRDGSWREFRDECVGPLHAAGGMMLWQICDNEEFARIVLDDSILRGGYGAISTFHFGCHNMIWALPFMMRYRHEIPFVSLQDAHGESWWWSGMLTGFRTLFLAREPGWEGWQEALREKRVVAVRRDARTAGRIRMLGGAPEVREACMRRLDDWRWWDDSGTVLDRMPVSVVTVRPGDRFEFGRPDAGVCVRIRVRREWVEGRKLADPSAITCVGATLDGVAIKPERVAKRDAQGLLEECCELIRLPASSAKRILNMNFREQTADGVREFTRRLEV